MRQPLGSKVEKWNVERLFGVKGVHHHQPLSVHPLEGCRADKRISWRVLNISLILVFVFVFLVLESLSVCPVSTHWRAVERTNGSAGVRARNLFFSAADLSVSPQRREIGIFQKKELVFRACFSAEEEKCPLRLAEENIHISSNKECFATGCREMRLPDKT